MCVEGKEGGGGHCITESSPNAKPFYILSENSGTDSWFTIGKLSLESGSEMLSENLGNNIQLTNLMCRTIFSSALCCVLHSRATVVMQASIHRP